VGSPPPGPRGIDLSTPPVLQLPIGQELGPSPTLLDGPGAGGSAVTVQPQRLGGAGLVVEAAKSIPARTLLDQGMPVRLTSGRTVKVRLRLLRKSGRGSLAAPVRVRIPKGRAVIVRLRPSRTGRRALRSGRVRTLKLEAFAGGHSRVLQRVRLR
jgi:hypothetical protein